ncbi:hypothetical protein [Magpiepox virus]|nr:hypothetical protein [Magpiepox virus]
MTAVTSITDVAEVKNTEILHDNILVVLYKDVDSL